MFCDHVIASPLWAEGGGEPIKVPLTTTAIPGNTYYAPPSLFLRDNMEFLERQSLFVHTKEPTKKLTLGGLECTVQADMPNQEPEKHNHFTPAKLIITTPTQQLIVIASSFLDAKATLTPVELTLDNERKYLLVTQARTSYYDNKKYANTNGYIRPGGAQIGKVAPPPHTTITLFDSNFDGFYTAGEDGFVIGSPAEIIPYPYPYSTSIKYNLVQPCSKYITIPSPTNGIFEIQNIAKDGSELTVLPYNGPTATLEVIAPPKYAGQIILTSDTGLNVTVNGKAGESVLVIPGNYTVLAAVVAPLHRSPRLLPLLVPWTGGSLVESQHISLLCISGAGEGGRMPPLKVEAGAKQVLTLSGPKVLEFQAAMIGGKITIKPDTLVLKGKAGETYKSVTYDDYNPPEVYLNVDGKSMLLGEMKTNGSRIYDEYSGEVPPPLTDIDLKTAKEVTVTLKMHLIDFDELAATVPLKMQ